MKAVLDYRDGIHKVNTSDGFRKQVIRRNATVSSVLRLETLFYVVVEFIISQFVLTIHSFSRLCRLLCEVFKKTGGSW